MDIEFHYHITYIVARRAGFSPEDAYIIAYSSQYTNDNTTVYTVSEDSPDAYSNYISQTMNIFKPQKELMRIYPVFHFLPGSSGEIAGDSTRRADGKLHLMNTIPNSLSGAMLLSEALQSGNPYWTGIATHVYADTFAHQNFAGVNDGFNDMAGLFEKLVPSIGHASVRHKPDIPDLVWQDKRLVPSHASVNNRERFLYATGCLFDLYRGHPDSKEDKETLIKDIDDVFGDTAKSKSRRIKGYKDLIGEEFIEYDDSAWFKDAIDFVTVNTTHSGSADTVPVSEPRWVWKDGYRESHWFKFQQAVKTHQEYVLAKIVRPIYEMMEQTTW